MDLHQQMHMIGFTAEFQQGASPPFQYFRKGFAQGYYSLARADT